eukprot:g30561.t1
MSLQMSIRLMSLISQRQRLRAFSLKHWEGWVHLEQEKQVTPILQAAQPMPVAPAPMTYAPITWQGGSQRAMVIMSPTV